MVYRIESANLSDFIEAKTKDRAEASVFSLSLVSSLSEILSMYHLFVQYTHATSLGQACEYKTTIWLDGKSAPNINDNLLRLEQFFPDTQYCVWSVIYFTNSALSKCVCVHIFLFTLSPNNDVIQAANQWMI